MFIKVAPLSTRAYERMFFEGVSDGAPMRERERERERVTNYLRLPNNSMSFLREKQFFPAQRKYRYYIRRIAANDYVSLIYSKILDWNVGQR